MFDVSGVSQLATTMQKPAGLNSGKALRTYLDMESETLIDCLRNAEEMILDVANLRLEEAKSKAEEAKERGEKLLVTYVGEDSIEKIDWTDGELDREKYIVKILPTSALSTTVSGRFEDVQQLIDMGQLKSPTEIRQMLRIPDLDRADSRALAMRKLLLKRIGGMLKTGKFVEPEKTWDFQLAKELASDELANAELNDAPPGNIDALRQFLVAVMIGLGELPDPNAPPAPLPAPMTPSAPGMGDNANGAPMPGVPAPMPPGPMPVPMPGVAA